MCKHNAEYSEEISDQSGEGLKVKVLSKCELANKKINNLLILSTKNLSPVA